MKTTRITILFSLLFLAGFTMANAQESETNSKGGFGMKGGLTFSTIGFDYEDASTQKNRFRIGGTAGFSYEMATPGFFAFEIGTLYDLRGTKEEINLVNGNEIVQKNYLHYITVPANFKFYIGDNFNIHFGPYVAGLAGGKTKFNLMNNNGEVIETKSYSITGEQAEDLDGDDYLKRVDAGLQAGLEFVSDKGIGVGSRFSKGLVDITNDKHIYGNGNATTTEVNVYMLFRF
ncbi:MAG: porin family protein [Chitinophagales bacterium]